MKTPKRMAIIRPRKPIPKMSKVRAREARVYAKRKKVFLTGNNHCFSCGGWYPFEERELHHLRGRSGKLYLYERFWRMACHNCHAAIHANPRWAIEQGLLAGKGEWNTSP